MRRIFLIIITSLLIFSTAAYLFNGQRIMYHVSFEYFLETVSMLDIRFESVSNFFTFIRGWISGANGLLYSWWNPLYLLSYVIEFIHQFLRFTIYFVGDIYEFLFSIYRVIERLLFFA